MTRLLINGRYTLQRTTGVQRVAREIVAALDRRLAACGAADLQARGVQGVTLLLPPDAPDQGLAQVAERRVPGPQRPHLWEQWALPRAARDGMLINLCGAAPAFLAGAQACVIHDAAVFDHPEAYTTAFVRWYRWLFAHHARRGTRLITVSAFSRQRLARALAVPPERFALMPLAADHLERTPLDPGALARLGLAGRRFVLAVASANPTKRLDQLVRVWAGLARGDASLVVAGGVDRRVFAGPGMPAARGVLPLGPVDDLTLKALYTSALGLVSPSVYEGFGLPPLEAMACGCPVAAARAASLPEVCADAALWFEPDDDRALAAAITALLDDDARRADLRRRGLQQAARFRWDRSVDALLDALLPVAAGAAGRAATGPELAA